MATTFTSNYQIKLIGTGLESGTWGTSTNENLKRIEQALGGATSIDPISAPTGSTSATSNGVTAMVWITGDTSDAGDVGSEGRSAFVEFKNSGSLTGNITVKIRGSASAEIPERLYLIKNNLSDSKSLILNADEGGSARDLTVENGAYALVFTYSASTDGDLTQYGVYNALATLQIDNLVFPAAADVTIPASTASALTITDGSSTFIDVNSSSTEIALAATTLDVDSATIDLETQATAVKIKDDQDGSLDITEGTNSYIECDTSNKYVVIGGGTSDCNTLDIDTPTIYLNSADIDMDLNASATALQFRKFTGDTEILTLDTNTPKVIVPVELEVTGTLDVDGTSDFSATSNFSDTATFSGVDINGGNIDGTVIGDGTPAAGDFTTLGATELTTIGASATVQGAAANNGYLNFNTTSGTSGYGFRDNSGKVEVKSDGGAWGGVYSANQVSGDGTYEHVTVANPFNGNSNYSNTHSLGATPRIAVFYTECISASGSYSYVQGDRIAIGELANSFACWYNSTSVGFAFRVQASFASKTTNTWANYTSTNALNRWKLCAHLWL